MLSRILSVSIICIIYVHNTVGQEVNTKVQWEYYFEDWEEGQKLLFCANEDVIVAGQSKDGLEMIIHRFAKNGTLEWRKILKEHDGTKFKGVIKGIVEDTESNLYFAVNDQSLGMLLLKTNFNGVLLDSIRFNSNYYNNEGNLFSKLLINKGYLYALGSHRNKPWLVKLTIDGFKVFEKVYNSRKQNFITSAILSRKGELIFSFNSGNFDKFGGGPSDVVILRFDEEIKELKLITAFPGKNAELCEISDNRYVVVFDTSSKFPAQGIELKLFDENFKQLWGKTLYENKMGTSSAFVRKYKNNQVVVTGVHNNQRKFMFVDFNGELRKWKVFPHESVIVLREFFVLPDSFITLYAYDGQSVVSTIKSPLKGKITLDSIY